MVWDTGTSNTVLTFKPNRIQFRKKTETRMKTMKHHNLSPTNKWMHEPLPDGTVFQFRRDEDRRTGWEYRNRYMDYEHDDPEVFKVVGEDITIRSDNTWSRYYLERNAWNFRLSCVAAVLLPDGRIVNFDWGEDPEPLMEHYDYDEVVSQHEFDDYIESEVYEELDERTHVGKEHDLEPGDVVMYGNKVRVVQDVQGTDVRVYKTETSLDGLLSVECMVDGSVPISSSRTWVYSKDLMKIGELNPEHDVDTTEVWDVDKYVGEVGEVRNGYLLTIGTYKKDIIGFKVDSIKEVIENGMGGIDTTKTRVHHFDSPGKILDVDVDYDWEDFEVDGLDFEASPKYEGMARSVEAMFTDEVAEKLNELGIDTVSFREGRAGGRPNELVVRTQKADSTTIDSRIDSVKVDLPIAYPAGLSRGFAVPEAQSNEPAFEVCAGLGGSKALYFPGDECFIMRTDRPDYVNDKLEGFIDFVSEAAEELKELKEDWDAGEYEDEVEEIERLKVLYEVFGVVREPETEGIIINDRHYSLVESDEVDQPGVIIQGEDAEVGFYEPGDAQLITDNQKKFLEVMANIEDEVKPHIMDALQDDVDEIREESVGDYEARLEETIDDFRTDVERVAEDGRQKLEKFEGNVKKKVPQMQTHQQTLEFLAGCVRNVLPNGAWYVRTERGFVEACIDTVQGEDTSGWDGFKADWPVDFRVRLFHADERGGWDEFPYTENPRVLNEDGHAYRIHPEVHHHTWTWRDRAGVPVPEEGSGEPLTFCWGSVDHPNPAHPDPLEFIKRLEKKLKAYDKLLRNPWIPHGSFNAHDKTILAEKVLVVAEGFDPVDIVEFSGRVDEDMLQTAIEEANMKLEDYGMETWEQPKMEVTA